MTRNFWIEQREVWIFDSGVYTIAHYQRPEIHGHYWTSVESIFMGNWRKKVTRHCEQKVAIFAWFSFILGQFTELNDHEATTSSQKNLKRLTVMNFRDNKSQLQKNHERLFNQNFAEKHRINYFFHERSFTDRVNNMNPKYYITLK